MAHSKTCQWLLNTQEYEQWLEPTSFDQHNGVLWIKGKPATGKSTIMKFAFTKAIKEHPGNTIISFFFNARGDGLEKSVPGMYRSLLFQLLGKLSDLVTIFDLLPRTTIRDQGVEWDIETLKFLFKSAVEKLHGRPLICYIDALDECDEDEIRQMLSFFGELSELAASRQFLFLVCLSSRHYPHITIAKGLEFVLEDHAGQKEDISTYVHSELKAGRDKQAEEMKQEIIRRSSGIFLWVVLVIQILNKEFDKGRVHTLRKRLNEIPDGLHELLKDIFTRDNENIETTLLCLQWVLYAKRPLSREELYFALLAGTERDPQFLANWTADNTNDENITRYILDSSKGLAEMTRSKSPTVQFIHESVRDFLQDEGLSKLKVNLGSIAAGPSHDALKICCLNYIKIDLPSFDATSSLKRHSKSKKERSLHQEITRKFPFLEYAVQNVLHHAESAAANGVDQGSFLHHFDLAAWVVRNNALEQHLARHYSLHVQRIYVFAERNYANLLEVTLCLPPITILESERFGHPLRAAVISGSTEAATVLLVNKFYTTELLNSRDKKGKGLLEYAARNHTDLVKLLLMHVPDPAAEAGTLLHFASREGYESTISLLLDSGADINLRDTDGCTPLHLASESGFHSTVRLLFERGAVINSRDISGRTPLSYAAAKSDSVEMARLLLEQRASPDIRDNSGRTPLSYAAATGNLQMIRLLLHQRAVLDQQDNSGRTPLSYAAATSDSLEILRLLLNQGATPDLPDNSGRTPLSYAAAAELSGDDLGMVILLLEQGESTDLPDNSGRTPLSYAAAKSYGYSLEVVRRLLDQGVVLLDQQDNSGRTPLSYAVETSHGSSLEIARLLLDQGAAPDLSDNLGRTPLSYAAVTSNSLEMMRLLLNQGAAPDTQDSSGRTPLLHAIAADLFGHGPEVVRLLLDWGADPNLPDNFGGTPLKYATTGQHSDCLHIHRLLLEELTRVPQ